MSGAGGQAVAPSATRRHGQVFPREPGKPRRSAWRELPVLIVVALVLAFLVKSFAFQLFVIPSGSMEQTLQVGDRVIVNKLVYHVRPIGRGDVVVFDGTDSFSPEAAVARPTNPVGRVADWLGQLVGVSASDEHDFVKRVIGIPGDAVACCDAEGRVTVNGEPLDESTYLHLGDVPSKDAFHVVVPPGRLWVMGDHRSDSTDSRAHLGDPGGGFVPEDRVIGRAVAVVWPPSRWSILSVPEAFEGITP